MELINTCLKVSLAHLVFFLPENMQADPILTFECAEASALLSVDLKQVCRHC